MAVGISDASGGISGDANGKLKRNPSENKNFKVDTLSCEIATYREIKERAEAREKKEMKNSMQTLKTAILVSAVVVSAMVVAVAGAAFAIIKKLKEK